MTNVTRARRQVRLSRALGLALTPKAVKHFEKQRLRAQYMLREKQLARAYENARKAPGLTGEVLVEDLETRLDAVILRAGFARTILQARQVVTHRHVLLDGRIVDRPSQRVQVGQTVMIKPKSQPTVPFQIAAAGAHRDVLPNVPGYLDVQLEKLTAVLVRRPKRVEVPVTCEVQLVVEYRARRRRAAA